MKRLYEIVAITSSVNMIIAGPFDLPWWYKTQTPDNVKGNIKKERTGFTFKDNHCHVI